LIKDAKRQYKDYLNKNIIEIVNDMVKNEDYDGLNLIFSMEILDRESCMSCIDSINIVFHLSFLNYNNKAATLFVDNINISLLISFCIGFKNSNFL